MLETALRDYQKEIIDQVFDYWGKGVKRLLIQSPTGSGKSIIIARICLEFYLRNQPIIIIAHKIELIRQLHSHVLHWLGYDSGIFANKSQHRRELDKAIQIVSIQSLALQPLEFYPPAALVVIDEAHHSTSTTYAKLFDHYSDSYIVGLTATPRRLDNKGFREIGRKTKLGFEHLITGTSVKALIQQGYLCPYKIFAAPVLLDPKKAGVKTLGGDFKQDELERFVSYNLLAGDVVKTWLKLAQGKRTVVYPTSVELSKKYCQAFQLEGIPAAHIDADTPPLERETIIRDFALGEILVLCQHSIVIEGVDIPGIEVVQFARPTQSLTIWFQAIGRALRPAEGKPHAIIIDHTTNHLTLPWVDHHIEWSLDPIQGVRESDAIVCQCSLCSAVFEYKPLKGSDWHPSLCSECYAKTHHRHNWGEPETREVVSSIELVEIQGVEGQYTARLSQLQHIANLNGYKKAWVGYQICKEFPSISLPELYLIAQHLGYQKGWAYYRYRELQNNK